jgi:beta-lactamase regulating signal transducer with metallopeptidase domain
VIAQEPKPAPAEPQSHWWPTMVWLCGSLVVAGRAVFARLVLAIFQRRRGLATDASLAKRVQSLAARLRMSDQVRVLESTGLASPIAFGLFRPAVGLPHRFGQTFTPNSRT